LSYGSRRPTQRRDKPRSYPSDLAVWVLLCVLSALLLGSLVWGLTHELPKESELRPERTITHDSLAPTYTYDGEIIRWYVLIDPDTGVQYLVNDRGGCTPRLDQYGNIMGLQVYE